MSVHPERLRSLQLVQQGNDVLALDEGLQHDEGNAVREERSSDRGERVQSKVLLPVLAGETAHLAVDLRVPVPLEEIVHHRGPGALAADDEKNSWRVPAKPGALIDLLRQAEPLPG